MVEPTRSTLPMRPRATRSLGAREVGLVLWSVLIVAAALLPILHDARHVHASSSCPACHFAQTGAPVLLRQPLPLGAPPVPIALLLPGLDLPAGDRHGRPPIVRGPPAEPRT